MTKEEPTDPAALADDRIDELVTFITGWATAPSALELVRAQHRVIETARALIASHRSLAELREQREGAVGRQSWESAEEMMADLRSRERDEARNALSAASVALDNQDSESLAKALNGAPTSDAVEIMRNRAEHECRRAEAAEANLEAARAQLDEVTRQRDDAHDDVRRVTGERDEARDTARNEVRLRVEARAKLEAARALAAEWIESCDQSTTTNTMLSACLGERRVCAGQLLAALGPSDSPTTGKDGR